MGRIVCSSSVFCWLLAACQIGDAQLVRVGPGGRVSVRAPFVRVDVGPYGGTYVRAPLTSIYAPSFRGRARYYRYPAAPYGPYEVVPPVGVDDGDFQPDMGQVTLPELRSTLVDHWNALQLDLSRLAAGISWQRHLALPPDLLAEPLDGSAAADPSPLELKRVHDRYERVAGAYEYRAISQLASFQPTRRLLSVYLDRVLAEFDQTPAFEELPPLPVPPQP